MCSYANENLGCMFMCMSMLELEDYIGVILGKDRSTDCWHLVKWNTGFEIKILNWVL